MADHKTHYQQAIESLTEAVALIEQKLGISANAADSHLTSVAASQHQSTTEQATTETS